MASVTDLRQDGATVTNVATPIIEPLAAQPIFGKTLDRFGDHYDTSTNSHLYRYLVALCGEAGAGYINKESLLPKLFQRLESTQFLNLDRLYGDALSLPRLSAEIYSVDPENQILSQTQWDDVKAKDAAYRERCLTWMRAILEGPTVEGMKLAGEAATGVDCDVIEQYKWMQSLSLTRPVVNSFSRGDTGAGATSITYSHTIVAGNNRYLFVWVSANSVGTGIVSGVTYGGNALTRIVREGGTGQIELWGLVNPSVGTANVVVTYATTRIGGSGAMGMSGVHQTTPTGTPGSISIFTINPTVFVNSNADDLVITGGWIFNNAITPVAQNQTVVDSTLVSTNAWTTISTHTGVYPNITSGWTSSPENLNLTASLAAVAVKPASPPIMTNFGSTFNRNEFVIIPRTVSITDQDRRRVVRLVDQLKPAGTLNTIIVGSDIRQVQTINKSAASTSQFKVKKTVTGRTDIAWPTVDANKGYWIRPGVAVEAPTFAFMDRQQMVTYISVDSSDSSSQHVGQFNTAQRSLFSHLNKVFDDFQTFPPDHAASKTLAPLNIQQGWVNTSSAAAHNTIVANIHYPLPYFTLEGLDMDKDHTPDRWWSSAEKLPTTGSSDTWTNLIPNGGAEIDISHWTEFPGTEPNGILERDTTTSMFGSASFKMTQVSGTYGIYITDIIGAGSVSPGSIVGGQTYTWSFWAKADSKLSPFGGDPGFYSTAQEQSGDWLPVAKATSVFTLDGAVVPTDLWYDGATINYQPVDYNWHRLTWTFVAPLGSVASSPEMYLQTTHNNTAFWFDGMQLEVGPVAHDYVDTTNGAASGGGISATSDSLTLNFGTARPTNFITFDITAKPFDFVIEYDDGTGNFVPVVDDGTNTQSLSMVYLPAAENPWRSFEYHFEQVTTTRLRITFTRRTDVWPLLSSQPFPYSCDVRGLRVMNVVAKLEQYVNDTGTDILGNTYTTSVNSYPAYNAVAENYVQPNPRAATNTNGWSVFYAAGSGIGVSQALDAPQAVVDAGGLTSFEVTGTPSGGNVILLYPAWPSNFKLVKPGDVVNMSVYVKGLVSTITGFDLNARVYNLTGGYITETSVASISTNSLNTWTRITGSFTVPADCYQLGVEVRGDGPNGTLMNYRATGFQIVNGIYPHTYVDNSDGLYWLSQPNPSKNAVESMYFDLRVQAIPGSQNVLDQLRMGDMDSRSQSDIETYYSTGQVVDEVFVDPVYPGANMKFYYSTDDTPDWDEKLWTPISTNYICKKGYHPLPTPQFIRYFKIEFSNLPAQPYQPVEFPTMPMVTYNEFPTWVTDYFSNVYPEQTIPTSLSQIETVSYEPLDLFQKVDDRMGKTFEQTRADLETDHDPEIATQIEKLLSLQVDQTTQTSIEDDIQYNSTIMWQKDLMAQVDPTRALGRKATEARGNFTDTGFNAELGLPAYIPPIQQSVADLSDVAIDKMIPPMWFPRTCRHGYKVVQASLDSKIAYMVAIRSVRFDRRNYTLPNDDPVYIETMDDSAHIESNDFIAGDFAYFIGQ